MSTHARRNSRGGHRRRGAAIPLAALGLGLAQIGAAGTGLAAPSAPTAPSAQEASPPCEETAKACVSLSSHEVWLTDGAGEVLRGPIRMNDGGPGEETPAGSYAVQRKHRYHVSQEADGASMPYAVFFDGEGRAFHQGDPDRESLGCIRMEEDDARFLFEHLDTGDEVQIVR